MMASMTNLNSPEFMGFMDGMLSMAELGQIPPNLRTTHESSRRPKSVEEIDLPGAPDLLEMFDSRALNRLASSIYPQSQADRDRQKNKEHEKEFYRLLEECCDEGICFCKYGEMPKNADKRCHMLARIICEAEEQYTPYSCWSVEELKTEVKHRKITLPKSRTKLALTKLLQHSDSSRPFRLMDLPAEVRLRVYSMVFGSGRTDDLSPRHRGDIVEPALLQTSRLIRSEATPVFYGTKYFRLLLPDLEEGEKCTKWFGNEDKTWLQHIGPDKTKSLRHVSFRILELFDQYDLQIDLASRSVSSWLIPFGSGHQVCPCQRQKKWTLMQWRQKMIEDAWPDRLDEALASVDACIETANRAIQDFHTLCSEGEKVEPTIAGLSILAEAAHSILNARSIWMFAFIDLSDMAPGDEEDEDEDEWEDIDDEDDWEDEDEEIDEEDED